MWTSIKDDLTYLFNIFCCCFTLCLNYVHFTVCMIILFFTLDLLWIILQAIGTWTDEWVFTDSCSWSGLRDICQNETLLNNSTRSAVYYLEIVSLALQGLGYIAGIIAFNPCCGKDVSGQKRAWLFCFICILPIPIFIAGLLNIVGCLIVAQTGLILGYSFYLCLSTGICVILQTVISMVGFCCIRTGKCQYEEQYEEIYE